MKIIIDYFLFVVNKLVEILDSISFNGSASLLYYLLGAIIIGFIIKLIKGGSNEFERSFNFSKNIKTSPAYNKSIIEILLISDIHSFFLCSRTGLHRCSHPALQAYIWCLLFRLFGTLCQSLCCLLPRPTLPCQRHSP